MATGTFVPDRDSLIRALASVDSQHEMSLPFRIMEKWAVACRCGRYLGPFNMQSQTRAAQVEHRAEAILVVLRSEHQG